MLDPVLSFVFLSIIVISNNISATFPSIDYQGVCHDVGNIAHTTNTLITVNNTFI